MAANTCFRKYSPCNRSLPLLSSESVTSSSSPQSSSFTPFPFIPPQLPPQTQVLQTFCSCYWGFRLSCKVGLPFSVLVFPVNSIPSPLETGVGLQTPIICVHSRNWEQGGKESELSRALVEGSPWSAPSWSRPDRAARGLWGSAVAHLGLSHSSWPIGSVRPSWTSFVSQLLQDDCKPVSHTLSHIAQ